MEFPVLLSHRDLRHDDFWRRIPAYSAVSRDEFQSHVFQIKHTVTTISGLEKILSGVATPEFLEALRDGMRRATMSVRITPYTLSLIDWKNPWEDPVRRQFLPLASSLLTDHPMLTLDSLSEQNDSPVPGLVHRYRDKVLFLPLQSCPVYCRFCTRSYAIGDDTDVVSKLDLEMRPATWKKAYEYIAANPSVEDVVVSGGDTYNLAAPLLRSIGLSLLAIPHVRRIRFASKGLAVMPMKILSDKAWTDALVEVSNHGRENGKQVALHTHVNSAQEITSITKAAMDVLFSRGVTVRNQSVLLRGVNDTPEAMALLIKRLGYVNITPYYVYQHDMVKGVEDLRTTLQTTLGLEKAIRGVTAGFQSPLFVVDAPGGGGKRIAWSYDHYNRKTGVSVFTAPYTSPGEQFLYFDPLDTLAKDVQERWADRHERVAMCAEAMEAAKDGRRDC